MRPVVEDRQDEADFSASASSRSGKPARQCTGSTSRCFRHCIAALCPSFAKRKLACRTESHPRTTSPTWNKVFNTTTHCTRRLRSHRTHGTHMTDAHDSRFPPGKVRRADAPTRLRLRRTLLVPRLIARLYAAADRPLRAKLVACMVRPLSSLGLAAVAAGAFSRFLFVGERVARASPSTMPRAFRASRSPSWRASSSRSAPRRCSVWPGSSLPVRSPPRRSALRLHCCS